MCRNMRACAETCMLSSVETYIETRVHACAQKQQDTVSKFEPFDATMLPFKVRIVLGIGSQTHNHAHRSADTSTHG